MQKMMKPPSSSSFPSLLRVKPRLSSYLFTLLAFILFAAILYGHDFVFIFRPRLHSNDHTTQTLFSTPGEFPRKSKKLFFLLSLFLFLAFQVPLALFGGSGNYASALYIASVKANAVAKVESELLQFVEAVKNSPIFSQFIRDLSVAKDVRVKVIQDICGEAKFSDVTKNFLGMISFVF